MKWRFLCASDLLPIEEGKEGIVTVSTRGEPASVYVHDNPGCRKDARPYPAILDEIKARFDTEGNRKNA